MMKQFHVVAQHRHSDAKFTIHVDARTQAEATEIANRQLYAYDCQVARIEEAAPCLS